MGQQRLGLARAFGSDASVPLLDEPTAHLDTHTENKMVHAIVQRAQAGATMVIVGNRKHVVAIGDWVY